MTPLVLALVCLSIASIAANVVLIIRNIQKGRRAASLALLNNVVGTELQELEKVLSPAKAGSRNPEMRLVQGRQRLDRLLTLVVRRAA